MHNSRPRTRRLQCVVFTSEANVVECQLSWESTLAAVAGPCTTVLFEGYLVILLSSDIT